MFQLPALDFDHLAGFIDIDFLKIDRSFVQNIKNNKDDLALCEAIIIMAHRLGIKVVAEGIETEEQLRLIIGIGCDYGQGFYFCKPLPAGEVEAFVKQHDGASITGISDLALADNSRNAI